MDSATVRARGDLHEAIREIQLMAGLDHSGPGQAPPRPVVIGVSSADFGDGKTTVAIALASSLSSDLGARVTLVDADLHTHSIGREFGLQSQAGLTNIIAGTSTFAEARKLARSPNLSVLGVGTATLEAGRVAHSPEFAGLIDMMRSECSFVVVDLPAALHSMTAPVLAQRCDGVVLVARGGYTSAADLHRVVRLFKDARILGVVINRARTRVPGFVARMLNLRS